MEQKCVILVEVILDEVVLVNQQLTVDIRMNLVELGLG